MSKRINIMLPDATLALLDRVAPRGTRSRLVSDAVLYYVEAQGKESRQQLKAGYLANADDNLEIAAEWFPIEEEAWQNSRARVKSKK